MEKISQDRFGEEGNCLSAVMATLFEVKLEDVPFFHKGCYLNPNDSERITNINNKIFWENFEKYLDGLGYAYAYYDYTIEMARSLKGVYLVGGMSPRGYQHAVLYKSNKLWHDPHPDGGGVIPDHIFIIYKVFKDN